ncbi:MAG: deoxyribose-phosphate aldolase [Dissulfurispiraceae bacterium]|jgi:deoxyribose-phosphate aldolase|nr:deoxyribose-phosphate aldolase [Dissulfurispiraceae bacterium]
MEISIEELKNNRTLIAQFLDSTLLKTDASEADIILLCKDAAAYQFKTVCVYPYYIPLCKALLRDRNVGVCTVIGFPSGMTIKEAKIAEAEQALLYGAQELDIVMNIGAAKSGNWRYVEDELAEIIKHTPKVFHKVIIECCYLTDKEKAVACAAALSAGAEMVKTSTGFGTEGAVAEDVRLMREAVGIKAGIKAAGGIKTFEQAISFIQAGADRIGTSSAVQIAKI